MATLFVQGQRGKRGGGGDKGCSSGGSKGGPASRNKYFTPAEQKKSLKKTGILMK